MATVVLNIRKLRFLLNRGIKHESVASGMRNEKNIYSGYIQTHYVHVIE